ncbi:MAG TPA: nicotinamide riboside transporter PnuC [Pseudomonadales bacterium]
MFLLEALAVALALAYLYLAARENIWCWLCAFASSLLYVFVLWDARLLTEAGLNVFYMVMAVAGWHQWRRRGAGEGLSQIVSMKWWHHVPLFALLFVMTWLSGYAMQTWTTAAYPFVDSFITWGSVITTVLVIRKVLENWLYWVLFDSVAIFLYINRGLYMTAVLFGLYVVIVIFGYMRWRRSYLRKLERESSMPEAAAAQ